MIVHCYTMRSNTGTLCGHISPDDRFADNGEVITCEECLRVSPWLNNQAVGVVTGVDPANPSMVEVSMSGIGTANGKRIADEIRRQQRDLDRAHRGLASGPGLGDGKWAADVAERMREAEIEDELRRWGVRRLASIDARLERERKSPRPTHIYSPSAPTDAVCGGCEYGHHITADVHEATCAQCLQRHTVAEVESGRGIVDVPGVPQRVAVAVGYDDPTGDDVAADVGPRWGR